MSNVTRIGLLCPTKQQFMINLVTEDLVATIDRLRTAGAEVADDIQESDFGKFAWAVDCDGRRLELWQPPETAEENG